MNPSLQKKSCAKYLSTLVCLLLLYGGAQSQLKADFSADKMGGCSPLVVSFTNKTTGASSAAVYTWDLGNGNTSSLTHAAAIYQEEKVYTVTLTVQDGSQTSVKTQQITVYSKPTVDFNPEITKGCIPFNARFNSTSTPGSGSISSYYWDFGDGATQQGFGSTQQHIYAMQQTATVSLTVTNSFGCHSTLQKKNIIEVIPSLSASFRADKTILCRESDAVQFTNTSAGPGTLSYHWDFGDGSTATERNPAHVFNRRGIYTVQLTVTSSEGCTATQTETGYINVASFSTDFTIPAQACSRQQVVFTGNSSPRPDNAVWETEGQTYYNYYNYFDHQYDAPGLYKVKLTNTYGACVDSVVKQVEVKPIPATTGFIATVKGVCGAPVDVDFRDTTPNAVSWLWNTDWLTGNGKSYTQQAFTHTYTENRLYTVTLKVTNSDGCSKDIFQTVNLPYPFVQITYTSDTWPLVACGSITMNFGTISSEPISQYRWEFGDGGSSTEAEPTYTFSKPGRFQIRLYYTTVNGCTGVAYYNAVEIYAKPDAAFQSVSGTTICGSSPVVFQNQTQGHYSRVEWYVNDRSIGPGQFSSITYQFQEKGLYTIKLVTGNGQCSDTAIRTDYIEVFPPFPHITGVDNTCDGNRGTVILHQSSKEAETWKWDFGDGATATVNSDQPTITHTYSKSGSYNVTLTTTNGSCTVSDSRAVYVLLKQNPALTAPSPICINATLPYTVGNLDDNPAPKMQYPFDYYFVLWQYEDGADFNGYNNSSVIDKTPFYAGWLSQPDAGKQQLRVILRSAYFDCFDTSNYVPVKIIGSKAEFAIVNDSVCFNTPVSFTDLSSANGTTIQTRTWEFGDGRSETQTQPGPVAHIFTEPGTYYVQLRITDDKGCTNSTASYTQFVTINGPKAAFTASGYNVPLNTTVVFYNNSNSHGAYGTLYEWDFGDGATSNNYSPAHTYSAAGTYTVKLKASDAVTGCSSEATQVIVVKDFNSAFNFSISYITSQSCPPVLVRFNNTSVNYTRVTWDFGDGNTLDNVSYPSHIYEKPGKYIVTLYVFGPNGLKGTYIDSIVVQQPRATMQANDREACLGDAVTLQAQADSTKTYIWDFGDGSVISTADPLYTHQYKTPGVYSPSLLVKDGNGCSGSASLNEKITIRPNPVVNIVPSEPVLCLGASLPLQASGGVSYSWSPSIGLSDGTVSSPLASPTSTTTYTVQVADDIGCQGAGAVTVTVVPPVKVTLPADLSVCAGNSVLLFATGAERYNWINNTSGLSSTQIANPTATPAVTTTYTVTGSDAHHCFSDTAEITVRVLPLPLVDAGAHVEVQAGTPVNFSPTYSTDVVRWNWTPSSYLNCSNCPAPISTPLSETLYTLTVANGDGCTAKDSLLVKMICDEARVAIPNAFTPNGDGKNDEFIIKGISVVKHLLIFNRWGQKVFERSNFIAADRSACWNGTLNGYPASEGTYVYYVEMECPGGGKFMRKGSFVLVR